MVILSPKKKGGNKLGVKNARRLECLLDYDILVEEEVDNNSDQEDEDRANGWE